MRRLSYLVILAIAAAHFALPASAVAAKRSLKVTVTPVMLVDCTVPPDQVRVGIGFEAKVKRKNVKRPSRITVSYKITDPATGEVKVAEKVTLKPTKYMNLGSFVGYTAGSTMLFDGSFTYKSTLNGKRVTSRTSEQIVMPTNEELAPAGIVGCV